MYLRTIENGSASFENQVQNKKTELLPIHAIHTIAEDTIMHHRLQLRLPRHEIHSGSAIGSWSSKVHILFGIFENSS